MLQGTDALHHFQSWRKPEQRVRKREMTEAASARTHTTFR
jgi:hypothetical protein